MLLSFFVLGVNVSFSLTVCNCIDLPRLAIVDGVTVDVERMFYLRIIFDGNVLSLRDSRYFIELAVEGEGIVIIYFP
jgi:hypothetical protein